MPNRSARAAYAANRGDADFAAFSTEVAKTLNDVAQIKDPAARLATAERAREKLADWPRRITVTASAKSARRWRCSTR